MLIAFSYLKEVRIHWLLLDAKREMRSGVGYLLKMDVRTTKGNSTSLAERNGCDYAPIILSCMESGRFPELSPFRSVGVKCAISCWVAKLHCIARAI